jgi:hypothetical protein
MKMHEISTLRLYLLRAMYLVMLVGLAITIWPLFLQAPYGVETMKSVVRCVLVGFSLMAALGLRYPVKMLPVLLLELGWKALWVVAFGIPLWLGHRLDGDAAETMLACMMGVVLTPLVIPWGYVWREYVRAPGDAWGGAPSHLAPAPLPQR